MVSVIGSGRLQGSLEREETFFLEIVGLPPGELEPASKIADRLRNLGTDSEIADVSAMSYVSEPIPLDDRVLVMLDAKGLRHPDVSLALQIFDEELSSAAGSVTADVAEGSSEFHHAHEEVPVVALAIMRSADYYKHPTGRIAALAEVVFPVLRELLPDALAIYRMGIDIPITWSFLQTVIDAHRNGTAGSLSVLVAGADLRIEVKFSANGPSEVRAAGSELTEPARFAQIADALKQVAAQAPGPPTSTIIKPASDRVAIHIGPRSDRPAVLDHIDDRAAAADRFAPGVGWSLTITPELWARIGAMEPPCDVHTLSDGRVELTFGEAAAWAPWLLPDAPTSAAAVELLMPHLITDDEWWPIMKDFSSTVVREWRAQNPLEAS